MRQWYVPPETLCRKHLLGEHVESHMFLGTLRRGRSIEGHVKRGQVLVAQIIDRHDQLADELVRRGYRHQSPVCSEDTNLLYLGGHVDIHANLLDLANRCTSCLERIHQYAIAHPGHFGLYEHDLPNPSHTADPTK